MLKSVVFLRLFCIYINFTLLLIHLVNLTTTLFSLVISESLILGPLTSLISTLRLTTFTVYVLTLCGGFYGVHNVSRGLVKSTISLFILTCILAITVITIHFVYKVDLSQYVGSRHINKDLIAKILTEPHSTLEHLKIKRQIDSIQCYYSCCGWESYREWTIQNKTSLPASCCLEANERAKVEMTKVLCTSESASFHGRQCKNAMNWYLIRAHKFTKYSCIVSFPLSALTCYFSIIVLKKSYLDAKTSDFFPKMRDLVVLGRCSIRCLVKFCKTLCRAIVSPFASHGSTITSKGFKIRSKE